MDGQVCPHCGNPVMPFLRFLRDAELSTIFTCSHCGVKLKRSRTVFFSLFVFLFLLAAASMPVFIELAKAHLSSLLVWIISTLWIAGWVVVVNFYLWKYVGWEEAE